MAEVTQVAVPDIGDFSDVPVIEVLVNEGDTVDVDAPLVTLESDKATMEIPAPVAGVVDKLLVKLGDKVSEGTPIASIAAGNGAPAGEPQLDAAPAPDAQNAEVPAPTADAPAPAAEAPAPAEAEPAAPPAPASAPPAPAMGDGEAPYASPLARRLARELGVELAAIQGSGRNSRISRDDVVAAAKSAIAGAGGGGLPGLAPWPKVDYERYGEVERVALSKIQKISGPNLARNWVMIPHVTHHEDADITDLEAFRKQVNAEHPETKVTMVALLMKAVVATLKEFPDFNASLDGDELVRKRYWNIGFAADTPFGLVVPVIKNVDQKGLLEVATELRDLSAKARDGKAGPADMSGATFTISSLGGIGGTGFTPIINAPEVAILGVTRSATKPVWDGSEFVPRLVVPMSLSYDHRVIDGATAARFMVHLSGVLSDLRRILL
ncbi:MAG TPA: dihydrolipoyllysine-residue acetyltransferase [Thermoleophilaceae bacterium]|nr:dihydrolipoyllysine-residue acetyltransferase [Thermoleophilaceae bacterium]